MNIAVVGGGRMGLPLACLMAERGAQVTVCDVNAELVAAIQAGECPYEEPGLADYLGRAVDAGRLTATCDTAAAVREAKGVVVIVPAWLTDERAIDYSVLKSASQAIGAGLQPGTLVSYETTVAVGGTRKVLIPVLESASGLEAGADFQVSFSPERVKANLVFSRLQETPKVIGGFDAASAAAAESMYSKYIGAPVIDAGSLEAAEFTKLADMIYRDVNIALANELAAYSEAIGADFEKVRAAANTSGEAHILFPGIGAGGHCTPVYPWFVVRDAAERGVAIQLPEAARHINDGQPARQLARLEEALGGFVGKRVHVLGLAFRPDVKVDSYSPAYALRDALLERGALPTMEDPYFTDAELEARGFTPGRVGGGVCDAVVLQTAHAAFRAPDIAAWRAAGVQAVVDGRNVWERQAIEDEGIVYLGVGKPAGEVGAPAG